MRRARATASAVTVTISIWSRLAHFSCRIVPSRMETSYKLVDGSSAPSTPISPLASSCRARPYTLTKHGHGRLAGAASGGGPCRGDARVEREGERGEGVGVVTDADGGVGGGVGSGDDRG